MFNGRLNAVIFAVLFILAYAYSLTADFMQNELQLKTTKELFINPDMPSIAIGQFGCSMYALVDIKSTFAPAPQEEGTVFDEVYERAVCRQDHRVHEPRPGLL